MQFWHLPKIDDEHANPATEIPQRMDEPDWTQTDEPECRSQNNTSGPVAGRVRSCVGYQAHARTHWQVGRDISREATGEEKVRQASRSLRNSGSRTILRPPHTHARRTPFLNGSSCTPRSHLQVSKRVGQVKTSKTCRHGHPEWQYWTTPTHRTRMRDGCPPWQLLLTTLPRHQPTVGRSGSGVPARSAGQRRGHRQLLLP